MQYRFILKGCCVCGGDLLWTRDYEEEYYKCLQCSRRNNVDSKEQTDIIVKLTGSDYHIKKARRDLKQVKLMVGSKTIMWVVINPSENRFVEKVARDLDLKHVQVKELPDYVTARCGVNVLADNHASLTLHEAHCKSCRSLKGKAPLPVKGSHKPSKLDNGKVEVVAKIEPGQSYDLNGIIASLELTQARLYAQLEEVDTLLANLKAYRDKTVELRKLEEEVKDRLHAAKTIVSKL